MKPLEELLEIAKSAKERADNAESGVVMVDPEQDHRYEFLKNWVISNRHDETHSHGDGIARFQSEFDADFFCYSLQNITVLADAVIDLTTQLKDAQCEIKSLNTFNTQFTRADKRSWGDLYIQVEQLEQRLAECETALKKAVEFGQYAEWAINESKDIQQLDIDSRAYLSKWAMARTK